MKIIIDANIFLNIIFNEEEYVNSSRLLLNAIEDGKFDAYISSLTLAEILWVVNKEDSKAAKKVQEYMYRLIDYGIIKIVQLDHIIIQKMLYLINRYNLTFVDSLIASTAMNLKCIIVTRDKVFKKIKDIKVSIPENLFRI